MFQCVVDSFACCISHLSVEWGEVRWCGVRRTWRRSKYRERERASPNDMNDKNSSLAKMRLKWPYILILSSFACKITLLIYVGLVLLVVDRYTNVWSQLRCAWEREELPKAIASRGWRHQQLTYLPYIINYILFMHSSPHLTSPHSTHPASFSLLCYFEIWYFCSAAGGWQVEGPRGGMLMWMKLTVGHQRETEVYELRGIRDWE